MTLEKENLLTEKTRSLRESVNKYDFKIFGWQNCYSVRTQSIVETLTFVRYLFAKICKINEKCTAQWKKIKESE